MYSGPETHSPTHTMADTHTDIQPYPPERAYELSLVDPPSTSCDTCVADETSLKQAHCADSKVIAASRARARVVVSSITHPVVCSIVTGGA